ncbi:MAG: hypothetical protein ABSC53_03170 [Bacteroidota bacterium]
MKTKLSVVVVLLFVLWFDANALPPYGYHGQIGGNQPCYYYGEIVSEYDDMEGNGWCEVVKVYIGNCQIEQFNHYSSVGPAPPWLYTTTSTYPGGCNCGLPMAPYNEFSYPLAFFQPQVTSNTSAIIISTPIPIMRFEVWNLVDNGTVVFSTKDSLRANQIAAIPKTVLKNGEKYLIVGYNRLNNADVYLSIMSQGNTITELQRFCSWGVIDSVDIQRECVTYVSKDSVMVYIQRLDKSGKIIKGTHGGTIGVKPVENNKPNAFSPILMAFIAFLVVLIIVVIAYVIIKSRKFTKSKETKK